MVQLQYEHDWNETLRRSFASILTEDFSEFEEMINSNKDVIELCDFIRHDLNSTVHRKTYRSEQGYSIINYIPHDTEEKNDRKKKRKMDFPKIRISHTYNKLVFQYIVELSMHFERYILKPMIEAFKYYISQTPEKVGRLGCCWATNSVIDWFDKKK